MRRSHWDWKNSDELPIQVQLCVILSLIRFKFATINNNLCAYVGGFTTPGTHLHFDHVSQRLLLLGSCDGSHPFFGPLRSEQMEYGVLKAGLQTWTTQTSGNNKWFQLSECFVTRRAGPRFVNGRECPRRTSILSTVLLPTFLGLPVLFARNYQSFENVWEMTRLKKIDCRLQRQLFVADKSWNC